MMMKSTILESSVHNFSLNNLAHIDPLGEPMTHYLPKNKNETDILLNGKFPYGRRTMTKDELKKFLTTQHNDVVKAVKGGEGFHYFGYGDELPNDWKVGDLIAVVILRCVLEDLSRACEVFIIEICE